MKGYVTSVVDACMQPVQLHGSLGREAATGRGTVLATRELLKHSRAGTIAGKSFVIQVSNGSPQHLCFVSTNFAYWPYTAPERLLLCSLWAYGHHHTMCVTLA